MTGVLSVSLVTLIIMGLFCLSLVWTFFFYRHEMEQNAKALRNIITTLENTIDSRENPISELHLKIMAKDLTDYKVNTREVSTEFVQTEPIDLPLEQATDEQFLRAIKDAPVEPADPVSLL